ncbi:hypothetical protein [Streptomyces malaysiensis]|uniref:Antibiotic biosynthesis monooxygenase n=1 Tax=Streptomyces malaysiensis TaxID=92644 RepID=A0A7X6B199_STRMQ|nr:hypothetical protein [Streptomyces malaysiensis]NIY69351.1 antibiotic biosynthesis monooxygenase [Streptomyces malaysiensis]
MVWWRDRESLRRWREDPRHRQAQHLGQQRWYRHYEIQVAELVREYAFPAPTADNEWSSHE